LHCDVAGADRRMGTNFTATDAMLDESLLGQDGGRRCSILVVDFGEHVFLNGDGNFRIALKALRNRINDLCVIGDLNELAIVIFINTLNSNKDAENIDRIFVHRPMGNLDAEYVKELDALLASGMILQIGTHHDLIILDDIKSTLEETLGGC